MTLALLGFLLAIDGGISTMLVMTAVSVALSVASSYLLKPKPDAPLVDDRPKAIASRGTFLPYVIGRRRIGHVVTYVGRYNTQRAQSKSSIGQFLNFPGLASTAGATYYLQSAVHALCVGPAYALWSIKANNIEVFKGPINQITHPSGSLVACGLGQFYIFWGEPDQPINTNMGESDAISVSSRWPGICYVVWDQATLGTANTWPQVDYEIETRPQESAWPPSVVLPSSQAYVPPSPTISGLVFGNIGSFVSGPTGVAYFTLLGDQTFYFQPGSVFQLTGNAIPNGLYPIYSAIYDPSFGYTQVFIDEPVFGANTAGTVEPYFVEDNDGINAAHIIAQILFAPFPYGLNLDPAYYDIPSLDTLGALLQSETNVSSVLIADGEEVQSVLAKILQDIGAIMTWNPAIGKFTFLAIRQPNLSTIPAIPSDALCGPLPEIESLMLERPADKLVFSFPDRQHAYRDMTIAIDDDGQALFLDAQKTRKIGISSTTVFTCAALIAERRALEELSGGSKVELRVNRAARLLLPGDAITCTGIIPILRVTETEIDTETREVKVTCVTDYYSCPESEFVNQQAQLPNGPNAIQPDLFSYIELPIWLSNLNTGVALIALKIRQTAKIASADNYISPDDTTFYPASSVIAFATGGTLNGGIAALDAMEQDGASYSFGLVGPDVSILQDLTASPAGWRLGAQVMVIDQEIFFVQKVTSLGGGQYQCNGVLRARLGTARAAHGAGATVFLLPFSSTSQLGIVTGNIFLNPQDTVYMKDQPIDGTGSPLALAFVEAQTVNLYGLNERPMPIANLRANGGTNAWKHGTDIQLAWNYSSVDTLKKINTGAGMQGAGEAQGQGDPAAPYFSAPIGKFLVNITTTVGVVKRAFATDQPGYDYHNADLVADFGSEPTGFIINVFLQSGIYTSPTASLQVNKF